MHATADELDAMSGNVVVYDKYLTVSTTLRLANSHISNSGRNLKVCKKHLSRGLSFSCGLALFLGNSKLTLDIANTNLSQNTGCNGGNMAVLFFQFASVTISHTRFIGGYSSYGGGAYVSFENSFLDSLYNNISSKYFPKVLIIKDSEFICNIADWRGGGVYIHWKQSLVLNGSSDVVINDTIFDGNSLGRTNKGGGLALHYKTFVDTSSDPNTSPRFHVNLDMFHCNFSNHNLNMLSEELRSESSVILATSAPYFGIHGITVKFNNCTAIFVIGSTLVFYGSTRVSHNRALTGAGIRICSGGNIYFSPDTDLVITDNHVQHTGGGMQVYFSDCLASIPMCFFQYTREITRNASLLESVNFIVKDNTAGMGGDNIFGGSIDYCYLLWVRTGDQRYRHPLMIPNNTIGQPSSISSYPQQICLNNRTGGDEEDVSCIKSINKTVYAGEKIAIFVRVVGQCYGSVSGTVSASIEGGVAIEEREKVQTVSRNGESITYTVYAAKGSVHTPSLNLQADIDSDSSGFQRYSPAMVHITFKDCPFGFRETSINSSLICQCSLNNIVTNCSIVSQTITKRSYSWIGMFELNNHTYLATDNNCPLDYCNSTFRDIKSHSDHLDQDKQ